MPGDPRLRFLNAADHADAVADLLSCCASRRWAAEVVAQRPYADLAGVEEVSAAVLANLDWDEVLVALDAHPRIGERARGHSREAGWSRAEQSGATTDDERLRADLVRGNEIYEQRFDHVFLVCATGLSAEDVRTALRHRLGNDRATERVVVRAELTKIVELRLRRLAG
ncbi:OHCU decarboxylase [Actinokineospora sp. NBRC 105648]|nr:OHCU decarboxylase [Actinokineospora sp. NBRC 105648]